MSPVLLTCVALLGLAGIPLAVLLLTRVHPDLVAARRDRDRAVTAQDAALRTLRGAAMELRDAGMALLGEAECLARTDADPDRAAAAVAAIGSRVLALSDDMQEHAPAPARRVLRDETLALEPLLRDTIQLVAATLGPANRQWRVAPTLAAEAVRADRRALRLILARVLANAARFSRHDDWIDISVDRRDGGLLLIVADEGLGIAPSGGAVAAAPVESRGLGLGLGLARTLMEAHGGTLTIEAAHGVGTRAALRFPPERTVGRALPGRTAPARLPERAAMQEG